MILSIIGGVITIIATVLAWYLNSKRMMYAELDSIYKELEKLYERRDKALELNNFSELTIVTNNILKLRARKTILLQRLG